MGRVATLIATISLVAFSCLTPIDFGADDTAGYVVIAGQISTLPERNAVRVGRTNGTNALPTPISGANVVLKDETNDNAYTFLETPDDPGKYVLPTLPGSPGNTYHLEVITPNGIFYQSRPERLPKGAGSLVTSYQVVEESVTGVEGGVLNLPFIKLFASSELDEANSPHLLKWSVEETFLLSPTDFPDIMGFIPPPCYVTGNADPQRIALYNGEEINAGEIKETLVGSRLIDWTFLEKHYLTIYQSALTKGAYEYWQQVNILANQVGSIFDSPPARIAGNISTGNARELVLGYFQATNETYDRLVLYPYELPFPLLLEGCTFRGWDVRYLPRCLDCLSIPNSSYERPTWF